MSDCKTDKLEKKVRRLEDITLENSKALVYDHITAQAVLRLLIEKEVITVEEVQTYSEEILEQLKETKFGKEI